MSQRRHLGEFSTHPAARQRDELQYPSHCGFTRRLCGAPAELRERGESGRFLRTPGCLLHAPYGTPSSHFTFRQ